MPSKKKIDKFIKDQQEEKFNKIIIDLLLGETEDDEDDEEQDEYYLTKPQLIKLGLETLYERITSDKSISSEIIEILNRCSKQIDKKSK